MNITPQFSPSTGADGVAVYDKIYIGGEWVTPEDGGVLESIDPSTGKVWARIAYGGVRDIDRAVAAARAAFEGPWGRMPGWERAKLLRRFADVYQERVEHLANRSTIIWRRVPPSSARGETSPTPTLIDPFGETGMILQNKPADVTAAAAGKPRAGMKLFVREGAPVGAVDINAEALDVRAKETENKGRKDPRRSVADLSRAEDMDPASSMRPTS